MTVTSSTENRQDFTDLVHLLQSAVERFGSKRMLGVLREGQLHWTTFSEFAALVDRFRAGLSSLGIGQGDKVAVIANNRLEWAVAAHACYGLGAAYVPMYEAQKADEWQYILQDSEAVACLVASDSVFERLQSKLSALPALRHVINMDGDAADDTSYAALLLKGESQPMPARQPDPKDLAMLIYTSGTTGQPKGVMLSQGNLAAAVSALHQIVDIKDDDSSIAFLPWAHVFGGCTELNLGLATGGAAAICGDATRLLEYFPVARPTALFAVPRVWNKIHSGVTTKILAAPKPVQWMFYNALSGKKKERDGEKVSFGERIAMRLADRIIFPKIRETMGGRLRYAISGAAALSREVGEFMLSLGVEVHEGYGLTETCAAATAQPAGAMRLGSVGKALPGVTLTLDTRVPSAGPDEGELIISGPLVMRGYHRRDKETRETLTPEGGLRTGDLARIDADGYVYITGRAKELYKLENGKYVAPTPIEERLERSPYIAQSMVTGQDQPHNVALIVPDMEAVRHWASDNGISGDDATILSHPQVLALFEGEVERCNAECKGYERIMDFVIDSEELTADNGLLTQTLKLKRRAIAAKYERELNSLYPASNSERPSPRASYIDALRRSTGTA